jgi:hypothetical protein
MIDLERIEAREIEVKAQVAKLLKFFAKPVIVPRGVPGDPVEREPPL